jgi:hypothetical protein
VVRSHVNFAFVYTCTYVLINHNTSLLLSQISNPPEAPLLGSFSQNYTNRTPLVKHFTRIGARLKSIYVFLRNSEIFVEFVKHDGNFTIHYYDFLLLMNYMENEFNVFDKTRVNYEQYNYRIWTDSPYEPRDASVLKPISISHKRINSSSSSYFYNENQDVQRLEIWFCKKFCAKTDRWIVPNLHYDEKYLYMILDHYEMRAIFDRRFSILDHFKKLMVFRPLIKLVQLAICHTIKSGFDKYNNKNPLQIDTHIGFIKYNTNFLCKVHDYTNVIFEDRNHPLSSIIRKQRFNNETYKLRNILHYAVSERNDLISLYYTDKLFKCTCWKPDCRGNDYCVPVYCSESI